MGINPSGRNNNNDLWISGAHEQHPDVQETRGSSEAAGPSRVSSQNNTPETQGFLSRISSAVNSFFSGIFGKSSSQTSSQDSSQLATPSSSRRSSTASDSDMDVEGEGSDTGSVASTESTR